MTEDERFGRQMDRYFRLLVQRIEQVEENWGFRPSHRRIKDGGLHVNEQRRAFKRQMSA
jgi:hypothetical protein